MLVATLVVGLEQPVWQHWPLCQSLPRRRSRRPNRRHLLAANRVRRLRIGEHSDSGQSWHQCWQRRRVWHCGGARPRRSVIAYVIAGRYIYCKIVRDCYNSINKQSTRHSSRDYELGAAGELPLYSSRLFYPASRATQEPPWRSADPDDAARARSSAAPRAASAVTVERRRSSAECGDAAARGGLSAMGIGMMPADYRQIRQHDTVDVALLVNAHNAQWTRAESELQPL